MSTVRVPANIDMNDKILYGLTVRQVTILAPIGVGLFATWHLLDSLLPIPALLIGCTVIAAAAMTLVLGKRDGTSLDRLVWAAIRQSRTVAAPGRADITVSSGRPRRRQAVSPLHGPVRSITDQGLDLGSRGAAVGIDATGVNFGLRSEQEQSMLVAGFSRLAHALPGSWQVVVSTRPATVDTHVDHARRATRGLPKGRLRHAASEYVAWLDELADSTVLLNREITVVVTAAGFTEAHRCAALAVEVCSGFGVTCHVLDGPQLAARARSYIDPYTPTTLRGAP